MHAYTATHLLFFIDGTPNWTHQTPSDVTRAEVLTFFSPLTKQPELTLVESRYVCSHTLLCYVQSKLSPFQPEHGAQLSVLAEA
jgi:hypothetical protein